MRYHPIPAAMVFACTAFAAQAQQIGVYQGTTEDGSSVYIQVAQDPNNENLEVKVVSFGLSMGCLKSGETLQDIGIGLGDGYDLTGNKFSYSTANFYGINLVTSMTFKGLDTVKGTVSGGLAAYNPAYGHDTPTKAVQDCLSAKQPFSATFTGAPTREIPAGVAMVRNQPLIKR